MGRLYVDSYLLTRTSAGAIGVVLPVGLMLIEGIFSTHGLQPRGSISAYYHTTAGRDHLAAGLCAVALLLLTYMAGQPRSADFIVSTMAGVALLGVVFFPTNRGKDLLAEDPRLCGPHTLPEPTSCSPTESNFGELGVAHAHAGFACGFIVLLAAISFLFAYRAWFEPGPLRPWGYISSGGVILAAGLYGLIGPDLGAFSGLYVGEVVALGSFGVAWFLNGEGIRFLLRKPRRA